MIAVTDAELLDFRALVARRLGLWFDDHRREFLAGVLRERTGARTGSEPTRYLRELTDAGESDDEWAVLASTLSVTETYFFRGQEHFQAFVETVLTEPRWRRREAPCLRLLSAGCASGEEAYTLAILLNERAHSLAGCRIGITGVDANREMLAKARQGAYSAWSLRETPPGMREKYFLRSRQDFVLDAEIRAMVTFDERNLAALNEDLWTPNAFDVVFCRNVLMYFTPAAATALVSRIERALAPGGLLFLGHAETLRGLSQSFLLKRSHGAFYYQLRDRTNASCGDDTGGVGWPLPVMVAPASNIGSEPATESAPWFDVIGRASARIAALSTFPPPAAVVAKTASSGSDPITARKGVMDRVLDLHRQERFTEALSHLQELPARAAGDADLQVLQAVLLVNCGRLDEAESLCRPLLGRDDLNASAHQVVALCREHAGDLAAAEEHDEAAAYLDPGFAMPRYHLGLICKRQGRTPESVGHFQDALGLLVKEDSVRLLLFGGGFSRETLLEACRSEIRRLGGAPAS